MHKSLNDSLAREALIEAAAFAPKDWLIIEGLRQNNLKNISLRIPHDKITAIVGLSGSGKSSLAFDTLFAEGRWRFLESLSTYTRLFLERMDRPDVDAVRNIRPAIALEQKNPVRKSRSTVGTTTEVYDYMRLLFARAGTVLCPKCSTPAVAESPQASAERLISQYAGKKAELCFSIDVQGKDIEAVQSELLKNGIIRLKANGVVYNLGSERPEEIKPGAVAIVDRVVLREADRARITDSLEAAYRHGGGSALVNIHEQETVRTERLFS
ncbi:MAG: excinuclease ABC subunit UvrA, partial [Deltaproteobacteria bacterium]